MEPFIVKLIFFLVQIQKAQYNSSKGRQDPKAVSRK